MSKNSITNEKPVKIFIVDDDLLMIELMTALLEVNGFLVSSNCHAVRSLGEIRAQQPDCILVDLQMAVMDGLELCQEIHALPKLSNTPVIVVSAHSNAIWQERAKEVGAVGYLVKPIDEDLLIQTINSAIGRD